MLTVKNLIVTTDNKEIIKGVDLMIKPSEIHVLMGPNGAGKTSLAMALMGHPGYRVKGKGVRVKIGQSELLNLKPEERARKGLFVAFQNPVEVTGVSLLAFLRTAYKALHPKDKMLLVEFKKKVIGALLMVGLEKNFIERSLNDGFSGGEKKRAEIAQLLVLSPKFAVLDEIDSGLDVDSLKIIASTLIGIVRKTKMGILLITHYPRLLHYIKPDFVHVLVGGKIVASDGLKLVERIEKKGYADF